MVPGALCKLGLVGQPCDAGVTLGLQTRLLLYEGTRGNQVLARFPWEFGWDLGNACFGVLLLGLAQGSTAAFGLAFVLAISNVHSDLLSAFGPVLGLAKTGAQWEKFEAYRGYCLGEGV